MLTHRNLLHQIKNLWDIVPAEPGARFLSMLPQQESMLMSVLVSTSSSHMESSKFTLPSSTWRKMRSVTNLTILYQYRLSMKLCTGSTASEAKRKSLVDENGEVAKDKVMNMLWWAENLDRTCCSFRIGPIMIVDEPFTIDNGLMTPTMKIRRDKVTAKYQTEMESLFEWDMEYPFEWAQTATAIWSWDSSQYLTIHYDREDIDSSCVVHANLLQSHMCINYDWLW